MIDPSTQTFRWHRLGSLALAATLVASVLIVGVGPAAAQEAQPTEPAVVVDIHENGDANLTVVMTHDLTNESDRAAFETFQNDDESLADLESRFADRMDRVAAATTSRVDREVSATNATATLSTVEDTGIVRLSVTMENLAAVEDGRIVLTEPFASGFATDRPVVVEPPADYAVDTVSPTPDQTGDTLTWASDTDFEGFELVLASANGTAQTTTATTTPGFGPLAVLLSVIGTGLFVRRRD